MPDRTLFTDQYECIRRFHRCGAGGLEVASELTQLVDSTLSGLWLELPEPAREAFAVVALGGYGRCEMSPHSDVDVMLLFRDERTRTENAETAQRFLHSLWNLGFDVGHSVRTIEDCLNLYQTDVDVWASVLESRYVCGSEAVMKEYTSAFIAAAGSKRDARFIASVLAGVDERHRKYEHSVKLLEPNLKNSAGGLRDLHALVWIFRAADPSFFTATPFRHNGSACTALLLQLAERGTISAAECDEGITALDRILRLRNELHYQSGTPNDILEFNRQPEIARTLGYRGTTPAGSVERCMREYYLHARTVYRLNQQLIDLHRTSAAASFWSFRREEILDACYVIRDRQLSRRDPEKRIASAAEVLEGIYWSGFHSVPLSPALRRTLHDAGRDPALFRTADDGAGRAFLRILRLPVNVASSLQLMNDLDLLGALLPEWNALVAFFQHSMYHYYTVDAHTLIAVEHAEQLEHSDSILGQTFRSLERKELLYFALLFHDIAKPAGIQGHETAGAEMWHAVRTRFGIDDPHDDVGFLIRHHLVMEQIAFRRNIEDPSTIDSFANLFTRPEQLEMLFILTYSDLSAVNKTVWSQWKEMLLQDLFLRTRARLTGADDPALPAVSAPEEDPRVADAIASLDTAAVLYRHEEQHSVVTILTRDADSLLSTLCGVLAANDAGIFNAQISTRTDGIVVDTFRVVNAATRGTLTAEQERSIAADLRNILLGSERMETLFQRHHRRWRRRIRPLFHPNVRVDAVFHDTARHTIIDIYAPDMTGFLYKITGTLARNGLRIEHARLATRGDGVVDSFSVTRNGKRISSEAEKQYLREKILHAIHQLMNVQLDL